MNHGTFWWQVTAALQSSANSGLIVDASDADLGVLHVKDDSGQHGAKVSIVILGNRDEIEIQIDFDSMPARHRKLTKRADHRKGIYRYGFDVVRYNFEARSENEVIPVSPYSAGMHSSLHVANIGIARTPQLALRIARWVEDVVRGDTNGRGMGGRSIVQDESDNPLLGRLVKEADAGNQEALDSAIEIIGEEALVHLFIEWLRAHAWRGRASAQLLLGTHLLGLPKGAESGDKEKEGVSWLKLAAEQSCPAAAYELAIYYVGATDDLEDFGETEIGCPESFYETAAWLVTINWAEFHPNEEGEERLPEAWRWLSRSAELGHPMARYIIAEGRMMHYSAEPSASDLESSIRELRKLAVEGHKGAITTLCNLKNLCEGERFNWAAHGAALGFAESQRTIARMLESRQSGRGDTSLVIKWLQRTYARSKDSWDLLNIGCAHYEDGDLSGGNLFRAIDAWKRLARWGGFHDWEAANLQVFPIRITNGHMLVGISSGDTFILDTGSATSPYIDELDSRFPGIKEHIHRNIDKNVIGIWGNDRIMSGSCFVLDMRHGDRGALWVAHSQGVYHQGPKRLPSISLGKLKSGHLFSMSFSSLPVGYNGNSLTAYVDTGAQYSYLRLPLVSPRFRAEDFTVIGGSFEVFSTPLEELRTCGMFINRECRFGNLPSSLSERVFSELNVDAIVGTEFLHGALLCWRRKDSLCLVQEGIHADVAESLIGTQLNAAPTEVPSHFESYFLGLGEYGSESFKNDISSVVPGDNQHWEANGTTSYTLNIIYFDEGGRAMSLNGRHRTLFIVACYFKVLIDQVFHHHFNPHHAKYESLADTVKLTLLAPNINPDYLLRDTVRDDPAAAAAFVQARTFFEAHIREQVREHFSNLSPDEVWGKVSSYLPTQYPYFSIQADDTLPVTRSECSGQSSRAESVGAEEPDDRFNPEPSEEFKRAAERTKAIERHVSDLVRGHMLLLIWYHKLPVRLKLCYASIPDFDELYNRCALLLKARPEDLTTLPYATIQSEFERECAEEDNGKNVIELAYKVLELVLLEDSAHKAPYFLGKEFHDQLKTKLEAIKVAYNERAGC